MDELGSRVSHCDTPQEEDQQASNDEDEPAHPNTRCIPFFYNARGVSYSVMWPVTDLEPGKSGHLIDALSEPLRYCIVQQGISSLVTFWRESRGRCSAQREVYPSFNSVE